MSYIIPKSSQASKSDHKPIYRRLDNVPAFTVEEMTLNVFFVGNNTAIHQATEPYLTQASWLMDGIIDMDFVTDGMISEPQVQSFISYRTTNNKITACILELGGNWLETGSTSRSFCHNGLLVQALQNAFNGGDTPESFEQCYQRHPREVSLIISVLEYTRAHYLVETFTDWIPAWIETGVLRSEKLLIMVPKDEAFTFSHSGIATGEGLYQLQTHLLAWTSNM